MKKKLLSVLLAGAMVLSLAACGSSGGSDDAGSDEGGGSEGGDKLVVWTWDPAFNIPAIEEAGKIYKETVNDKFELEVVETLSDDCETKLQTCAESGDFGTMPDIVLMQDNSYQKFVSFYPEAFTDLTDSGIDFSQFAEGKLSYSTVDGKITVFRLITALLFPATVQISLIRQDTQLMTSQILTGTSSSRSVKL